MKLHALVIMDELNNNSTEIPSLSKDEIDKIIKTGRDILSGKITDRTDRDAFLCFRQASLAGDAEASGLLAGCYLDGTGTEKDRDEAFRLASGSFDAGDPNGAYVLGRIYEEDSQTAGDLAKALLMFSHAAEKRHAGAQFKAGEFYYYGTGTEKDIYKAKDYLVSSASQGNEEAKELLKHVMIAISQAKSEEENLSRAETGDRDGILSVLSDTNLFHTSGKRTLEEAVSERALAVIRKAEAMKDPEIQYQLYRIYAQFFENDFDMERREASGNKAIEFLKASAYSGKNPHAMYELGKCYLEGYIVRRDTDTAISMYTDAGSQGDIESMIELGDIYWEGRIVQKDLDKAYTWTNSAILKLQENDKDAGRYLYDRISKISLEKRSKQISDSIEEAKKQAEIEKKEKESRRKRRKDIWDSIEYNAYGVIAAAAMFLLLILYRYLGAGLFNEPILPVHGLPGLLLKVIAIGGTAYSLLMMLMGILSPIGLEELSAAPAGLLALALAVGLKNLPKILKALDHTALAGAAVNLIILLIKLAISKKK